MSKLPLYFRDPIHGLIEFENNPFGHLLVNLINCKEFQRLRRIKQLGFSEYVYLGASHSRFAHSIGTLAVARNFLTQIKKQDEHLINENDERLLLLYALLHDIGHGPFSHVWEKVCDKKHEAWTSEILNNSTEVHQRLEEYSRGTSAKLRDFMDKAEFPARIISSQFDADRCDYLMRDAYSTGTNYGNVDFDWLINNILFDKKEKRFYFREKAIHSLEQYLFARFHMYQSVYFHKTTRSCEVMLRLLFTKFKSIINTATVKTAPESIKKACVNKIKLQEFLELDDSAIFSFLVWCSKSKDRILRDISSGILNRNLFKCIDVSGKGETKTPDFVEKTKTFIRKHRLNPEFYFSADTAEDTPYKVYYGDDREDKQPILVEKSGIIKRIEEMPEPNVVNTLKEKITRNRYYFWPDLKEDIQRIAEETLKRG